MLDWDQELENRKTVFQVASFILQGKENQSREREEKRKIKKQLNGKEKKGFAMQEVFEIIQMKGI